MESNIPYYMQNDDVHCFQTCLKMVLKHFLPDRDFSIEELDKISGRNGENRSWVCLSAVNLKRMGFYVRYYSVFDYKKFSEVGYEYMKEIYGNDIAEIIRDASDIESEMRNSKDMLSEGIFKLKRITLEEIENWLAEDYNIIVLVNWGRINAKSRISGHFVLVTGTDKNYVYTHDPGNENGSANRRIGRKIFMDAWKNPEGENALLIKR